MTANKLTANRFWSPLVATLSPYVPGEQPRRASTPGATGQTNQQALVKLNTNENPFGPSPRVLQAIMEATTDDLRLYPDPESVVLKEALARRYRVGVDEVFVGNGSDEVLGLTFAALLKHELPLLFPDISYSFYPVYCALFGIDYQRVPLSETLTVNPADYLQPNGGIIITDDSYLMPYYGENPDVDTEELPPDSWLRRKAVQLAWSLVGDWNSSADSKFYDEAVRLHISENQGVREALANALAGHSMKDLIESHVERVELRLHDPRNDIWVALQDVGVGTSQVLPIILEAFAQENKLIAIEQPELHLHPRLQAELGDVFIESALGANKNTFLLETHSEHLILRILRILRRIRETTEGENDDWPDALREACPNGICPADVAILFVQPDEDGAKVIELPIDANGEFTCDWPGGFFEERMKELF